MSFVQSFSQALPAIAVLAVWGRQAPAPHRRLSAWCLALIAADMVDLSLALLIGYNTFTDYIILPIEVGLTLWILAAWQPTPQWSKVYLYALGAVGLAACSTFVAGDIDRFFGLWIAPALALIALGGVLHTLVGKTLRSSDLLARTDWFWICLGLGLFWIGFVPVPPFVRAYLDTEVGWVRSTYISRAWLSITATLFITWGVLCPRVLATRSLSPS